MNEIKIAQFHEVTEVEGAPARVTWLPVDALVVLSDRFFDRETCIDWFLDRCYPAGPACPRCGGAITSEAQLKRWRELMRLQCPHCAKKIKATIGTVLAESHLDPRGLFVILALLGLGVELDAVARVAGVSPATVRNWREKVLALAEVGR